MLSATNITHFLLYYNISFYITIFLFIKEKFYFFSLFLIFFSNNSIGTFNKLGDCLFSKERRWLDEQEGLFNLFSINHNLPFTINSTCSFNIKRKSPNSAMN